MLNYVNEKRYVNDVGYTVDYYSRFCIDKTNLLHKTTQIDLQSSGFFIMRNLLMILIIRILVVEKRISK